MEDKAEITGKTTAIAKVELCDTAKVLLPSIGAPLANLCLPPKKRFEKKCGKQRIEPLGKMGSFDQSSQST